jgi:hypothetical protein
MTRQSGSLCASRLNCSRSSIGAVSNRGTAHLAFKGGAMQFRRSVTDVLGRGCYGSTRAVPWHGLTFLKADERSKDGERFVLALVRLVRGLAPALARN